MIRVVYEPRIASTHIKDEIWYPEINRSADELYDYLYHEAGRSDGLTVITYSPYILDCLEVITKERNLEIQVEFNGNIYTECLEDIYMIHARVMQEIDHKRWSLEDEQD